ncbi:hypothetical protein AAFF_G00017140 [Aldrovandia affinis]|uniref:Uncharacterized protein n=1 Tax=Aldrovandia affinis TaxID=143900 RepID=A0AAD7VXH5_9TELE|nr:hypothetical protein AAFF_G00017140 [Aldrovandia affinis]
MPSGPYGSVRLGPNVACVAEHAGTCGKALRLPVRAELPYGRPCHRAGLEQTEALEKVVLSSWAAELEGRLCCVSGFCAQRLPAHRTRLVKARWASIKLKQWR